MLKCFTSLLLLLLFCFSKAQDISISDSSTFTKVGNTVTTKADELTDYYKTQLNGTLGKLNFLDKINHSKVTFSGSVSAEGEYISNYSLPESANGFYYRTGITGAIKVGQIPFNAGVTINYRNKKVWAGYTLANFSFDYKGFLTGLKSSYLDYLSDIGNFYPTDLAGMVKGYQDSLNRFNDLKGTLTDKSYYDKLRQFNIDYKSLQDSVLKGNTDSCAYEDYERVSDSIKQYKNMASEFANLEKYKSANTDLAKYLNDYNGYLDSVKNMKNVLSNPDVKTQLSKSGLLSKEALSFSGVQKLGIGRVNLELSEFTSRNQSIYGFNFDYLIKGVIYAGVGLGLASPNNYQFNPSLTNLNQPIKINFSKYLGYLRFGLGTPEEDHLHLIYLSFGDKFSNYATSMNPTLPPPANSVLSLVYKKKFKELVTLEGEFATSNSSFTKRSATFSPLEIENKKVRLNYAARTLITFKVKKTSTTASIKGTLISNAFRSAGNFFQRRDFAEYSIALTQPAFDNKLNVSFLLNHSFNGIFSNTNPTSFINMNSTVSGSPFSFLRLTVNYTYLKQVLFSGRESGLNSHQLTFNQQYNYGKGKVNGITVATLSYTDSKNGRSEAHMNNRVFQGGLMQGINLPKGISLNIGAGISYLQSNGVYQTPTYWIETGNNFNIKSVCSINYSFKYLKDYSGRSNFYATAGLNATLYKGLQFRITEQLQILAGIQRLFNTQTMAGLNYTFSYTLKKQINLKLKTQLPPFKIGKETGQ